MLEHFQAECPPENALALCFVEQIHAVPAQQRRFAAQAGSDACSAAAISGAAAADMPAPSWPTPGTSITVQLQ
jgi:hypothetical protein